MSIDNVNIFLKKNPVKFFFYFVYFGENKLHSKYKWRDVERALQLK